MARTSWKVFVLVAEGEGLDVWDILLNNQAVVHIFKNRNMLDEVAEAGNAVSVQGVGG